MVTDLLGLDLDVFYAINHGWADPFLDRAFGFITRFRNLVPALAILVVWLLVRGGRRGRVAVLAVAITVGVSDPLTVRVLKPAFDRERPCVALEDARLTGSKRRSPSFPSAHAVNAFAAAVALGRYYPVALAVGLPIALLSALSRVYLGLHYPSDVVAGAVLGTLLAFLVVALLDLAGRGVPALAGRAPPAPITPVRRVRETAPPDGDQSPRPRA